VSALDSIAITVYAIAVLAIGARAGRGHASAADFYVGQRNLPTWAVLLSMVATELSAATFIGVPQAAYAGDWSYLQFALGAGVAKCVIAWRVLPLYYELEVVTVYGALEQRYGPVTRRSAAACFALGRLLASGVRLFIAALAVAVVSGASVEACIVACGLIAGVYTAFGGIRAVIFTDVLQALLLVLGAAALLAALGANVEGGLIGLGHWAADHERLRVIHATPLFALADSKALGVALIGGFFLTLATHTTDHDMVQRLLTTRDARRAGRALVGSALLNFPLTAVFLLVGTGLAYAFQTPPDYDVSDPSRIVPLYALHSLAPGLRGLVFAGIFAAAMSSLDSAICAIATTVSVDLLRPLRSDADTLRRTRVTSAFCCAALIGAALWMSELHAGLQQQAADGGEPGPSLVEFALSSMTILYGGLLGVFSLAIFGRRVRSDAGGVVGLAVGAVIGLGLFLHESLLGQSWIAWPWWIPISAPTAAFAAATFSGWKKSPEP
jgi:SSS family solute:Na+ symporter